MVKLLIIADDFTGALDTGVQFASRGAVTSVVTDPAYDFSKAAPDVQVLVLDVETRHLPGKEAYALVYRAVKDALAAGFTNIYKKTDSGLRGNIGAELAAALDASGEERLYFVPAFPKIKRITRGGIHYIDGVPVAESVFGKDPFEPVRFSDLPSVIGDQAQTPVTVHGLSRAAQTMDAVGIHVFDAETDEHMQQIVQDLGTERLLLSAGCAGFSTALAEALGLTSEQPPLPQVPSLVVAVCGSVNPVTLEQLQRGEAAGFPHIRLEPAQKLESAWLETDACKEAVREWARLAEKEHRLILDANDAGGNGITQAYGEAHGMALSQMRVQIADTLGALTQKLLDSGLEATFLCTGGDTLLATMKRLGVSELAPVREVFTGVVLNRFVYGGRTCYLVSKSGGFGTPDVLADLAELVGSGR